MEIEKKFKTKTGFCHILTDKIVLSRDGIIGDVAKVTVGNNSSRILLIYGGLTIYILYSAFNSYQEGKVFMPIFFSIIVLYLIYRIITSINYSATAVIDREKIKTIKFKKAIKGLTRSRFEVFFENKNGKIMKRLIMLPGSLTGGDEATKEALDIMREEALID